MQRGGRRSDSTLFLWPEGGRNGLMLLFKQVRGALLTLVGLPRQTSPTTAATMPIQAVAIMVGEASFEEALNHATIAVASTTLLLLPYLISHEVCKGKWGAGARGRKGRMLMGAKRKKNGWAGVTSRTCSPHISGNWGLIYF